MKMKKISTLLIVKGILLISFIHAGSISPTLALRFNDVAGSSALVGPSQSLGLKMDVGSGVYSGFDTNGLDFRIFVQQSFGMFGLGTDDDGDPQFTVGGYYNALDNLNVSVDYVINRLTDDGTGTDTPDPDKIRVTLAVTF